jgi:HAMP domain-containing protein
MSKLDFKGGAIRVNGALAQVHPPHPFIFEDFLEDSIAEAARYTVVQATTETTAAAISVTAGDPVAGAWGWIAGATDDIADGIDELALTSTGVATGQFRADQVGTKGRLICEWATSLPALTARYVFAGWTDDREEGAGDPALAIAGTTVITDRATDAAGWMFSSAATDTDGWHYGATDGGTQDTAISAATAAATTWVGLRTELDVLGDAYFFIRESRFVEPDFLGKSVNGTSPDVLLTPQIAFGATTTTAVAWEVDYGFASAVIW